MKSVDGYVIEDSNQISNFFLTFFNGKWKERNGSLSCSPLPNSSLDENDRRLLIKELLMEELE